MGRYRIDMAIWVETERGPDPSVDQVVRALTALLRSDTMYVSVDQPNKRFENARLFVDSSEVLDRGAQVIE